MQTTTEQNKHIVTRFNKEFIEGGNVATFDELMSNEAINHTAPVGTPNGKDGMFYFMNNILRIGLPDIKVEILDQIAEGDLVTTRKIITGTHQAEFMGVPATGRELKIHVIDIIRIKDGKYTEHWGITNLSEVMAELTK